jgi:hypothetical protein
LIAAIHRFVNRRHVVRQTDRAQPVARLVLGHAVMRTARQGEAEHSGYDVAFH